MYCLHHHAKKLQKVSCNKNKGSNEIKNMYINKTIQ